MTNKVAQAERNKLTAYARRLMERDDATPVQAQEALRARTEVSPGQAFGCVAAAMRQMRGEQGNKPPATSDYIAAGS